ncbi:hypothetical protein K2173_017146 [Erythroxylum novogranatense]|uniref:Uncharacterized protein n=1 Tax=Erythroxylum novogranatense TaxID=1862640 RepID=A0AAV8U5Y8_9ROSI|nr:hypothetical protein K2173_017146 [Erythroxylum novogranatense]
MAWTRRSVRRHRVIALAVINIAVAIAIFLVVSCLMISRWDKEAHQNLQTRNPLGSLSVVTYAVGICHGKIDLSENGSCSPYLARTLSSLCKASRPEPATVINQVKKLEVSELVLGQKRPSPLVNCKGVGGYLINIRWKNNFWLLA